MFKYSDISPETRFPDSYSKLNKSVELTKHNNDAMVCLEHN
jgi:heme oxygenase